MPRAARQDTVDLRARRTPDHGTIRRWVEERGGEYQPLNKFVYAGTDSEPG